MFKFKKNYNLIILFIVILYINSCNSIDKNHNKIIIDDSISKQLLKKNKQTIKRISEIKIYKSKVQKNNLKLLDKIDKNITNENNVTFEFRNERLLQGSEITKEIDNQKSKNALNAVFKMLNMNTSLDNQNLNINDNKTVNNSIDYSLEINKKSILNNVNNILVFLPFTGSYAKFGNKIRKAIDLSTLKLGSDKIKVIYFDTGKNYLLNEIESIFNEIKPNIIIGPFTREAVLKIKPYAKKNSIPMLTFTNDISLVEKNVWSLGFSPEEQIDSVIACALKKGYKNYGLIVPNNLYGKIILDRSKDNLKMKTNIFFKELLLSNEDMNNKTKLASKLKNFLVYSGQTPPETILLAGSKNFILAISHLIAFYNPDETNIKILLTEISNDKAIINEPSLEGALFPKLINKNRKDFKLTWKKIWSDDEDFFSRIGFDSSLIAINYLNQNKLIQNSEGWTTGFKFSSNGYVQKPISVMEINKSGKVKKTKGCINVS